MDLTELHEYIIEKELALNGSPHHIYFFQSPDTLQLNGNPFAKWTIIEENGKFYLKTDYEVFLGERTNGITVKSGNTNIIVVYSLSDENEHEFLIPKES